MCVLEGGGSLQFYVQVHHSDQALGGGGALARHRNYPKCGPCLATALPVLWCVEGALHHGMPSMVTAPIERDEMESSDNALQRTPLESPGQQGSASASAAAAECVLARAPALASASVEAGQGAGALAKLHSMSAASHTAGMPYPPPPKHTHISLHPPPPNRILPPPAVPSSLTPSLPPPPPPTHAN